MGVSVRKSMSRRPCGSQCLIVSAWIMVFRSKSHCGSQTLGVVFGSRCQEASVDNKCCVVSVKESVSVEFSE